MPTCIIQTAATHTLRGQPPRSADRGPELEDDDGGGERCEDHALSTTSSASGDEWPPSTPRRAAEKAM